MPKKIQCSKSALMSDATSYAGQLRNLHPELTWLEALSAALKETWQAKRCWKVIPTGDLKTGIRCHAQTRCNMTEKDFEPPNLSQLLNFDDL